MLPDIELLRSLADYEQVAEAVSAEVDALPDMLARLKAARGVASHRHPSLERQAVPDVLRRLLAADEGHCGLPGR